MSKNDFIQKLESKLTFLSTKEKKEVITYYNEMIEDAMEDGLTEKESIEKLGTFSQIIQKIKEENGEKETVKKMTTDRIVLIIVLSPFLFTLLTLWASIIILIYSFVLTLYVFGFAFILIAFAYTVDFFFSLVSNFSFAILELGLSILSIGLSMFLLMGMNRIFKKINFFTKQSFIYIMKWIRGY